MGEQLKILILEDSVDDVDLIKRELLRGGIDHVSTVVKTRQAFEEALHSFQPDIVLSDHSLPQFNSIEAMAIWKEWQKDQAGTVPFILITGSVSEEFAVQSIKAGASDYILKDRLKRLPSSIKSALDKARLEKERLHYLGEIISQASMMKEAEHMARFGSWQVDLISGKHRWSDEAFRIFGFEPGEIDPDYQRFFQFVHPEDKAGLEHVLRQATKSTHPQETEFRIIDKDGKAKILHSRILVKNDENERVRYLVGFTLDITQQRKQTEELELQNRKLMEIAWVQSHEVRAPLARIIGLVQLVSRYPDENVNLKTTLGRITESANDLDEIIRKIVRKTEEIV